MKLFRISIIAIIVFIIDQITKSFSKDISFNTKIFSITYVENIGAAFSILQGWKWFFIIVAFIVIMVIFRYLKEVKEDDHFLQYALGFLLGGTLGNLIDRLFLGYVIDFINFKIWPVFNIADTFNTIAVIMLIIHFWKNEQN